jgi:dimethylargininase
MREYGGHSMARPLRRVVVCRPETTGWGVAKEGWKELGYFHPPRLDEARSQHERLIEVLKEGGAEVLELHGGGDLTLDAVYTHDASFPTNHGMVLMRMGKPTRRGEPSVHEQLFDSLRIPVLGRIEPPGLTEGGDIVWLDEETVLVGEGYRTNEEGIAQLRALLSPHGVEVLAAPLSYGPGPDACLHLMSLISILEERTALVDLPWLSVSTVRELERRDFHLIPIDARERDTLACNVLALGNKKLLAIEENTATNQRLRREGFEVATYPGSEISQNGSGGPTCLTRPILRD